MIWDMSAFGVTIQKATKNVTDNKIYSKYLEGLATADSVVTDHFLEQFDWDLYYGIYLSISID